MQPPEEYNYDDHEEWMYWFEPKGEPSRQEAERITHALHKYIIVATLDGLRAAMLLARVSERKLYTFLGYPELPQYALHELHLDDDTLDRYLRLHAWARAHHPEWLSSDPPYYVRDLHYVADVIWLETTLVRDRHAPKKRERLIELHAQALKGELNLLDLDSMRRRVPSDHEEMLELLEETRETRDLGYRHEHELPPEVLKLMDRAVDLITNQLNLHVSGLDCLDEPAPRPKKKR